MPYRRWDPFQDLISLHQELFNESSQMGLAERSDSAWTPAVDIYETPESYVIKAELPGIDPDLIKLEYRDQKLILSGQRPPRSKDHTRKFHQLERSYGPFTRAFMLPDCICCQQIDARYEEGILEVVLPKEPKKGPKTIIVNARY